MTNIFQSIPDTSIDPARQIAANLLTSIEREATRRAGEHADQWRSFWQSSEATPQEIADEMGTQAGLFFGCASENVEHINEVAQLVGLTAADFMPSECLTTPVEVTVNGDGTVAIGES